jgi:hypothetical protein
VYPHSTVQPRVLQYRQRSPCPYFRVKEEGEIDKKPPDNKLTTLAGNLAGLYIEESMSASQSMVGTNEDGLVGTGLKLLGDPSFNDSPRGL